MNYNKHTALRLEWSEVGHIASKAIADIIGRSITCVGKRDDETYWEIQFVDYQMPAFGEIQNTGAHWCHERTAERVRIDYRNQPVYGGIKEAINAML